MKKTKLLLLLLSLPLFNFAQEKIKAIRVNEAYMNGGFIQGRLNQLSVETFEKLIGETDLLLPENNDYFYWYNTGTGNFNLGIGLQLRNKEKTGYRDHIQLRAGISYRGNNSTSRYSNQDKVYPYDTLVSQQTGQEYYLDSIVTNSRSAIHYYDMLSVDAAMLFRSHPKGRWSLYGGLGVKFGISTFAQTQLSNRTYAYSSGYVSFAAGNTYYQESNGGSTESFNNGTNTELFLYLPVGIDFRVSNNNNFFNKLHLTMDLTTNYRNVNYSNIASHSVVGFGMNFGAYMNF